MYFYASYFTFSYELYVFASVLNTSQYIYALLSPSSATACAVALFLLATLLFISW